MRAYLLAMFRDAEHTKHGDALHQENTMGFMEVLKFERSGMQGCAVRQKNSRTSLHFVTSLLEIHDCHRTEDADACEVAA